MVRIGLVDLLTARGEFTIVGQSGTVAEAREEIPRLAPDIAVLDARLPDGSGIELCRYLQSAAPGVRCVLLTSYDESDAAAATVVAGAYGYFLKSVQVVDLSAALKQVAAGVRLLDPDLTGRVTEALRARTASDMMSARERAVRDLLAEGCTDTEISERLGLPEATVRIYVADVIGQLITAM